MDASRVVVHLEDRTAAWQATQGLAAESYDDRQRTTPKSHEFSIDPAAVCEHFGKFELLGELGHGGMGMVYRARDVELNRQVAIKTIKKGEEASATDLERFKREAQAVAALKHPNILPIHEYGTVDQRPYFVMPLAARGSLMQHLPRLRQNLRDGVAVLARVAHAIAHLHACQLIHRDLKPSNILLDETGQPLVSDFGLVRPTEGDSGLTVTGQVIGTPAYMAPEQAAGKTHEVGPPADVWALGVILYELATGQVPFRGPDKADTLRRVLTHTVPAPRTLRPEIDRTLERIILRCLHKDPRDRTGSARELADQLDRWSRGEIVPLDSWAAARRMSRRMVRHPAAWLVGLVALLAFTAWLTLALSQPDPIAGLRPLQRQLAAGEPVKLVGPTGPPRWSVPVLRTAVVNDDRPRAAFNVTGAPSLGSGIELYRGDLPARYRVEADVQQLRKSRDTQVTGEVGIFLGHVEQQTDAFTENLCLLCLLRDYAVAPPDRPRRRVERQITVGVQRWLHEKPPASDRMHTEQLFRISIPPKFPEGSVLHLGVEHHHPRLTLLLGGEELATLDLVTGAGFAPGQWRQINERSPVLRRWLELAGRRRAGLGIWLHDSTAVIRNVTLLPLPPMSRPES